MQPHLFCFGLGYTAKALAKELLQQGWRVSGTCRTQSKCDTFRGQGISTWIFDQDLPLQYPEILNQVTHILLSIPPVEAGDIVLHHHKEVLLKSETLGWVGYFSTTGVYGDHGGEWVNEATSVNPPNERSKRRVVAEQAWLETRLPVHIFRLSGIYGPGRDAIASLRNGSARRIDKKDQVFSRIHIEDIVQVLLASLQRPNPGSIYNVADDLPAPQEEVVAYAAKLLGTEAPPLIPYEQAELSGMARSFYQNNRRVSNQKIKQELGVVLKYPDYKAGLERNLTLLQGAG